MAAPIGNQFWKLRAKHGPDRLFNDPKELEEAVSEYFTWVDTHPWWKNEPIKSGESVGKLIKVYTARPYTIAGLCNYLGVSEKYWRGMRSSPTTPEDLLPVIRWADLAIEQQQFEGAAVGAFNANIIATKQGLAQKIEQRNVDKDGNDVKPEKQVFVINGKEIEF